MIITEEHSWTGSDLVEVGWQSELDNIGLGTLPVVDWDLSYNYTVVLANMESHMHSLNAGVQS